MRSSERREKMGKYAWDGLGCRNLVRLEAEVRMFMIPVDCFCLDKISFSRDYNSARVGCRHAFVRRPSTIYETSQSYNFCKFRARGLRIGTVFPNI